MSDLGDDVAVSRQRLARHLVKRLVRRSWLRAVDRAVERGLLASVARKGTPVVAFKPGDHLAEWTQARFVRLLERALGPVHGQDKVRERFLSERTSASASVAGAQPPISEPSPPRSARRRRTPSVASRRLLDLVRAHAAPPSASDVATVLILVDAVARSGHGVGDVLAVLRKRTPVVTISGGAPGFERTFMRLLKKGMILPSSFAWTDGMSLTSPNDLGWRMAGTDEITRIIAFRPQDDDTGTGKEDEKAAMAAQSDYPVLGIADRLDDIPQALMLSADLHLQCEPLSPEILRETMRIVLGNDGEIADDGLEGCDLLALPDLALAIRSDMTPARSHGLLRAAVHRRRTAGKDHGRTDDKTRKSKKTPYRRGVEGTGSTIVQPIALDVRGAAAVPTVETLSGYGEARDWALALKDDLDLWKAGNLPWDAMTTRLLLHGPPGTGKTTFARALCNTLQIPLVATSVGTWLEPGYLGDVLQRMSAAFDEAASHKPAILFIDEIDGIGKRVTSSREHADYWNSVVNRALELLDGAVKSPGVIIIGATNAIAAIDAALLRAGRLETHIEVPLPDTDALVGILRHHLKQDVEQVVRTASLVPDTPPEAGTGQNCEAAAIPSTGAATAAACSGLKRTSHGAGEGSETDECRIDASVLPSTDGAHDQADGDRPSQRKPLLAWLRHLADALGLAAGRIGRFINGVWLP